MAKIKLNLPTGVVEEKTLVTAFEEGTNKYIIFDADSVGSMGLPIILVCKIVDNRVVKIADQNEWSSVKGYLKEMIQGNSKKYITVGDSIDADETYFTQLTLPVASFETIRKGYLPVEENVVESSEIPSQDLIVNEASEPVVSNDVGSSVAVDTNLENANEILSVPNGDSEVVGQVVTPSLDNVEVSAASNDSVSEPELPELPVLENDDVSQNESVVDQVVPEIVTEQSNVENQPVQEEVVVETQVPVENDSIIDIASTVAQNDGNKLSSRDAFLKACGDMFDALISAINENK